MRKRSEEWKAERRGERGRTRHGEKAWKRESAWVGGNNGRLRSERKGRTQHGEKAREREREKTQVRLRKKRKRKSV